MPVYKIMPIKHWSSYTWPLPMYLERVSYNRFGATLHSCGSHWVYSPNIDQVRQYVTTLVATFRGQSGGRSHGLQPGTVTRVYRPELPEASLDLVHTAVSVSRSALLFTINKTWSTFWWTAQTSLDKSEYRITRRSFRFLTLLPRYCVYMSTDRFTVTH